MHKYWYIGMSTGRQTSPTLVPDFNEKAKTIKQAQIDREGTSNTRGTHPTDCRITLSPRYNRIEYNTIRKPII